MKKGIVSSVLIAALGWGAELASTAWHRVPSGEAQQSPAYIQREVRHQLVMLPYYSIFDDLEYHVDGYNVTLMGSVVRPTLKSDAENVVKKIEGVQRVINNIKVLPVSTNDDRIRLAEYRAIYGHPSLNRYALQAVGPIHIIVENGNVTLKGVVANQMDKNIANVQANSVPGVFSVKNELQVEESGAGKEKK